MVLLQLTSPLQTRLEHLIPQLPLELQERVAAHLVVAEEGEGDKQDREAAGADGVARGSPGAVLLAIGERTVPHEVLVEVGKWARKQEDLADADDYRLESLLRLTDVHAPPLAPRVKSPELLAILADIQLQQDRASYTSMTSLAAPPHPSLNPMNDLHDPTRYGGKPKTAAEEWKEIRREVGAILNVGASMLAVGTAVWWVGGGRSYAARLSLAMSGAVAIAAIEAFLYYRFFTRHAREEAEVAKRKARGVARKQARGAGPAMPAGAVARKGDKQE
ncbi:hypothetical protein JCM8547_003400 [Rhodosporidiobolus lusitaniae]